MNLLAILAALGLEQWHAPAWRVSIERAFVRQARALERKFNGGTAGQGAIAAGIALVPVTVAATAIWWTHDADGITQNDLACAARTDALARPGGAAEGTG